MKVRIIGRLNAYMSVLNLSRYLLKLLFFCGIIGLGIGMATPLPGAAQQPETTRQPLDIMLVIDDSCSMFPRRSEYEAMAPTCTLWGNDPNFLRIKGADLFIARLGFGEANVNEYQLGVISLGVDPPTTLIELGAVNENRDEFAARIENPVPREETQVLAALRLAYEALTQSPNRRPGNQPAVVFLTDGRPFPLEGQSETDLLAVINQYPGIPLFVILLENPDGTESRTEQTKADYARYIAFWEQLARENSDVETYRIRSTEDIEQAYNRIISLLQSTTPSRTYPLDAEESLEVYVGRYVQKLTITIVHEDAPEGEITITDPSQVVVRDEDPGVERFRGVENPVEVISIGAERLDQAPRDDIWTIRSSVPVNIHLDFGGAYTIVFDEPVVTTTSLSDQYSVRERVSPLEPFTMRFHLMDRKGMPVLEPEPVSGTITDVDGNITPLDIPPNIEPDANGIYTIQATFPFDALGRYTIHLKSGDASPTTLLGEEILPIAQATLLLDVGRGAYIANIIPATLICRNNTPQIITVTLNDVNTVDRDTIRIRAIAGGREISLAPQDEVTWSGDIAPLCDGFLAVRSCNTTANDKINLRLAAASNLYTGAVSGEGTLPVTIEGVACTPTPTSTPSRTPIPTSTPTPTPSPTAVPTPIPNTDNDSQFDPDDQCLNEAEWGAMPYYNGCPPPITHQVGLVAGAGGTGAGAIWLLFGFILPWLWVQTPWGAPPKGKVMICQGGKQVFDGSLDSIGRSVRSSRITIGSKGIVKIEKTQATEVIITRDGERIVIENLKTKAKQYLKRTDKIYKEMTLSNGNTLRVSNSDYDLKCG